MTFGASFFFLLHLYFAVSRKRRTFTAELIHCSTKEERSIYAIILQQSAKGQPARP